jgi:hypothetical protein
VFVTTPPWFRDAKPPAVKSMRMHHQHGQHSDDRSYGDARVGLLMLRCNNFRDDFRPASLSGPDRPPARRWPRRCCQIVRDLTGQGCGVEPNRAQRATRRNAVPYREHAVADVACKPAARATVHIKNAKMAGQTLKVSAEPGGRDDYLRCNRCAIGEDNAIGCHGLHGSPDPYVPGPHRSDEFIGQRWDATALFHRRLQSERGPAEAVVRKIPPHKTFYAIDQRIDHARRNPREDFEEDIRGNRSHRPPHEVRRGAHRKPDSPRAMVCELHGDVRSRIAGAYDEDVAPLVRPGVSKVAGVNQLAGEMLQPGPGMVGVR